MEYCYSCSLLLVLIYGSSIWMKIHNASSSSICLDHFPSFCLLSLPLPAPSLLADPLCIGTRSLRCFRTFLGPCFHPGSCWLQTDWSQTMKLRSFTQGRKTIRGNSQFRNCPSRHWVKSHPKLGSSSILGCILHSCTKVCCNYFLKKLFACKSLFCSGVCLGEIWPKISCYQGGLHFILYLFKSINLFI